jgi:arylsulfatase A-like enzyme/Flp pilus assembly protein TadD
MEKIKKALPVFLFCGLICISFFISPHTLKGNRGNEGWNVLLITIDTLRADRLSCYSREHVETPNVDALSERGVLFRRAFANTSTTLPSHVNILTGITPLYHGVHDNGMFRLEDEFLSLSEILKSRGYTTGAFVGAYPLDSRFGLDQGFDVYDDDYSASHAQKLAYVERKADEVVDRALEWLTGSTSVPWFCWIHCYDPHDPYEPPEPFQSDYTDDLYNGEVAYVDSVLGRLVGYMEKSGLFSKTLVVFTGDHGESLGQHGETTHGYYAYNTTIWVPLIFLAPGIKARSVDNYASHIDILPTVCEALGIKIPDECQGHSLWRGLKGRKLKDQLIYFESMYPYYSRGWAPLYGFISNRRKYISSPIPEIYDLDNDFDETVNLADRGELKKYENILQKIIQENSFPKEKKVKPKIDREAMAKLRSLGYVSSTLVSRKDTFGPSDDIKSLLPFHNKSDEAMKLYEAGNKQEGVRLLREVLTERPDIDIAYSHLATIYREMGRMAEALEVLSLGLEKLPESYEVLSTYINFLLNDSQYDEVIGIFQSKSLLQMDHDPEIWNYLGGAYVNTGEFDKAILAYERALDLDGDYPVALNNLGTALFFQFLKSKDESVLQRAVTTLGKAIAADPDYATPYNGLGLAYRSVGRLDEAVRSFERALLLNPDFGDALYNLGLTYIDKGDKAEALVRFSRYKQKYLSFLSEKDKEKLEALIAKCQREP